MCVFCFLFCLTGILDGSGKFHGAMVKAGSVGCVMRTENPPFPDYATLLPSPFYLPPTKTLLSSFSIDNHSPSTYPTAKSPVFASSQFQTNRYIHHLHHQSTIMQIFVKTRKLDATSEVYFIATVLEANITSHSHWQDHHP